MNEIHTATSRGQGDHGWLQTKYSFSFADYHDPKRMGFGKLRVVNDDTIAPGQGFPTHPHQNMEIITIVTKGALRHTDNTGAEAVLKPGDVQVMSAGSGIMHAEYNHSATEDLELFQIWILPDQQGIMPRHEEMHYHEQPEQFTILASGGDEGIMIHQDAAVMIGTFTKPLTHQPKSGSFLMVVAGKATVQGKPLSQRDAIMITKEELTIVPQGETRLLLIDVPVDNK